MNCDNWIRFQHRQFCKLDDFQIIFYVLGFRMMLQYFYHLGFGEYFLNVIYVYYR